MPKGGAAKLIARDARKHKEERRVKVRTNKASTKNQHEYLRRKKKRKTRKNSFDNEDIFGHDGGEKAEIEPSVTDTFYQEFMNSPNYILTSQPKLIEELSSESDEEVEVKEDLNNAKDTKIN